MDERQTQLAKSSLSAAMSSLNLAMEILGGSSQSFSHSSNRRSEESHGVEKPLMTGIFDGLKATCADGKVYDVAPIYIVKAGLVVGDTLKLDRLDSRGKAYFLQYKRVKRKKETGVIAKKEGKWVVVTASGSYKLYPEAIERWQAQEGDEATVLLPEENPQSPYASVESVVGREVHDGVGTAVPQKPMEVETPKVTVVKEVVAKGNKGDKIDKGDKETEEAKEKEEKKKATARVVQDDDLK